MKKAEATFLAELLKGHIERNVKNASVHVCVGMSLREAELDEPHRYVNVLLLVTRIGKNWVVGTYSRWKLQAGYRGPFQGLGPSIVGNSHTISSVDAVPGRIKKADALARKMEDLSRIVVCPPIVQPENLN